MIQFIMQKIAAMLAKHTDYRLVRVSAQFQRGDVVEWSGLRGVVVSEAGPEHAQLQAIFPGAQPKPLIVGFDRSGRMFPGAPGISALFLIHRPVVKQEQEVTQFYDTDSSVQQEVKSADAEESTAP